MKTIGIFTTSEYVALKKLLDIIFEYRNNKKIEPTKHISDENCAIVEFSNGDYYKWIKPNANSRERVTDAIIDIGACSCYEISTIILPRIVNFDREPQIAIFDSSYKNYSIDILIDRLEKVKLIKGNLEVGYNCPEWGIYGDMEYRHN